MAELTLDIFNGDAFSNASLSAYVNNNVPFRPGLLGSMGLFTGEGVFTPTVAFDDEDGSLSLIESSPRGSAPSQSINRKGTTRYLKTVRLAREAAITADQVVNVRVLGTATQLQTAERIVFKRVEGPVGLKAELSYTMENMQLGAIDGQVYDADATTLLWDYFATYGVSRPTAVNFAFSTATAGTGVIGKTATDLKRSMVKALNGFPLNGAELTVLCGDNFYDALRYSGEVLDALKTSAFGDLPNAVDIISSSQAYDAFRYAGIRWINYRGSDDGAVGINTDSARAFMRGVPGLFQSFFGPADTWDFANTEGLPSYLIQRRERQTESARVFELQSNPLPLCLRPKSLYRLTKS
jgi:hypothetical protein